MSIKQHLINHFFAWWRNKNAQWGVTLPEQQVTVLQKAEVMAPDIVPIHPVANTAEPILEAPQPVTKPSAVDEMIAAGVERRKATEPSIPRLPRKAQQQTKQLAREVITETQNDIPLPGDFIAYFDHISLMPTVNQDEGAWIGWHAHAIAQINLIHVCLADSMRQEIARCQQNHIPTVALFRVYGPALWERYHQTMILDHLAAVLSSALGLAVTADHLASVWTVVEDVHQHGWEVVLSVDDEVFA